MELTRSDPGANESVAGGVRRLLQLRVVFARTQMANAVRTPGRQAVAIGRDPGDAGGLALDDDRASRLHARLQPDGDGWVLVDAGSKNGTFVDGARVERAPLRHGSVVRIGGAL